MSSTIGFSPEIVNDNKATFARVIAGRAEFLARYGALSDEEYLTKLTETVGVQLTLEERASLMAILSGAGLQPERRARVLMNLVDGLQTDRREDGLVVQTFHQ